MIHKDIPVHKWFGANKTRRVTKFLVVHWPDAPGWTPENLHKYLSTNRDRYAGIQDAIGIDGEVYAYTDSSAVVYHCGGRVYTEEMRRRFPEFTENSFMSTPNWCSWGVEVCHPEKDGKFTQASLDALRKLLAVRMKNYGLDIGDVYRHHDVTGKDCPRYFVQHPEEWQAFKESI